MNISLDGLGADADGTPVPMLNTIDDKTAEWIMGHIRNAGAHLMGSNTYRDMMGYWPYSTESFAEPMKPNSQSVASRSGNPAYGGTSSTLESVKTHAARGAVADHADLAVVRAGRSGHCAQH